MAVLNTLTGCSATGTPETPETPEAANSPGGNSAGASGAGPGVVGSWKRVNLTFVSVYLLVRGDEVAVVDTGTSSSVAEIEAGLQAAGTGWGAVKHVIVTHGHQDHAGGLAGVAPAVVNGTLYAGDAELDAITASKPLKGLADGQEIFGLQIIGTPGHTLGHISVFEPSTGVLVAGDALNNTAGLTGSNPEYTADAAKAAASVKKLATLDVQAILPGHGEPLITGAPEELQKLAASL
ncbi:MBL fold metallo-hydrolase [Actinoplanes sp. DH11]|uniref:MBL fold metallo-hydrolase n=1 Tax=Actinoplanes sp. DH11 TaxID=2857011 RepID=UPI001E5FB639|nr:MBL fold metallo-hydrolase [Actinoplanes sp. DH11]